MIKSYKEVVEFLEGLSIMPKDMPGIKKLQQALASTSWYAQIDPKKVIIVAGTNGKGTTCAMLESLLDSAGKSVGFYSSPHLIDTTERIRTHQVQISQSDFVKLFNANADLIVKFQLTHFEALTLMCGDYFFSSLWQQNLDYAIFEVGLGGLFDATNAIPHATSVITALGLDHTNILGSDLKSIAKNKFGIVQQNNLVIHQALPIDTGDLKDEVRAQTNSVWIEAEKFTLKKRPGPTYNLSSRWGEYQLNMLGARAAENAALALTVFERLGFKPGDFLTALSEVIWYGRMQLIPWRQLKAPLYLSGDHNVQGIESLQDILKDFTFKKLFVIVGIGHDKQAEAMLNLLYDMPNTKIYLTETPFKGLRISDYPEAFIQKSSATAENIFDLLDLIQKEATKEDLVIVTGSLYLVGKVLAQLTKEQRNN